MVLSEFYLRYRKEVVWATFILLFIWLAWEVREVTTLLLFAYAVALLLDPLVCRITSWSSSYRYLRLSRTGVIVVLGVALALAVLLLVVGGVPWTLRQYSLLVESLPHYLETIRFRFGDQLEGRFGVSVEAAFDNTVTEAKEWVSALNLTELRRIGASLGSTVLQGYSVTLTLINLALLPFFIFYILRDLPQFHALLFSILPVGIGPGVRQVSSEVLEVVHTFFRAQFTIAVIGALLYGTALTVVGLPSGFIIGILTGLLNVVPYLGVLSGVAVATIVALVADPGWSNLLMVWGAFVIVNFLQDTFVAPRILGERLGLHPLAVMLALIVGGHLLGLLGLIVAIPAAASIRVLFHYLTTIVANDP